MSSSTPQQGPLQRDLASTPPSLWLAVVLLVVGVALVGGAVVAFSHSTTLGVVLLVAGVVVGAVGAALARAKRIMSDVA